MVGPELSAEVDLLVGARGGDDHGAEGLGELDDAGAHTTRGGDALYLTDNKTGKVAVYIYNPTKRSVDLSDVQPIMSAFMGPPAVPVTTEPLPAKVAESVSLVTGK